MQDEVPQQDMGAWRPGDHLVRIWPSDELTNISADGRRLGRRAANAFREALGMPPGPKP